MVRVFRDCLARETEAAEHHALTASAGGTCRIRSSASSPSATSSWLPAENSTRCAGNLDISESTSHRWRSEYDGINANDAKRLKELEAEGARPKKLPADAEFDKSILKELAGGNFWTRNAFDTLIWLRGHSRKAVQVLIG